MARKSTTWAQVYAGLNPKQKAQADSATKSDGHPHKPAGTRKHPDKCLEGGIYRSEAERCAAAQLTQMVKNGDIISWHYERWTYSMPKLAGAKDRSYKPDFIAWREDGMTIIEIKSAVTREQRVSWYKAGYEKFQAFVEEHKTLIECGVLRAELWEYDHRTGGFSIRTRDKSADDWLHENA